MDAAAAGRAIGRRLPAATRVFGARRPPLVLLGLGLIIGLASALPALYLVVAVLDDASAALDAVLTSRTLGLITRSLGLAAAVTRRRDRDRRPARLADRALRPARAPRVGDARHAAARHPELHRRLPLRLGARAARRARRPARRPAAVDLRLRRRVPRADAVHLSARADPAAQRAAPDGPLARGGRARHGPRPARGVSQRRAAAARARDRRRRRARRALHAERLRRGVDHALQLLHARHLRRLPVGLRPHGGGGARDGARDRDARALRGLRAGAGGARAAPHDAGHASGRPSP